MGGEGGGTRTAWAVLLVLDRGLGFGMVWGVATALGLLRVLAVLGIREPVRR